MEKLQISVGLQIQKPIAEVFDAIVDPEKMKNYFISESTGRMVAGEVLQWKFPEFDMTFPVTVLVTDHPNHVAYSWAGEKNALIVDIVLTAAENNSTVVKITEGEMDGDEAGIRWLKGNTEGWANFLACLKAYVEHGINLRKGAFDYRREEFQNMQAAG